MDPAERSRFLGNAKADAARLSQLVTRLLDLARADMAQPDPGKRRSMRSPRSARSPMRFKARTLR